jgi:hypothetical protein
VDAVLCEGDVDVYQLESCVGGQLEIIVDFDIANTDLDLRLIDGSGRLLNSSAVALAVERLSQSLSSDEMIYLEVYGYLGAQEGAYSISAAISGCSTQAVCTVDAECDAGQSCDAGRCVTPPVGCIADADCAPTERCLGGECVVAPSECVFDFDCAVGERCEDGICASDQPSGCDFDIDCGAGERCVASTCVPDNVSMCTSDLDCPEGNVCEFNLCLPSGPQADDRYEENDDAASAASLLAGNYQNLTLLTRDDDFYSVDVCAGGTLNATISFFHGLGDLELSLKDSNELSIDVSASSTDNEDVSWTNRGATDETVYLVVYGFLSASNTYSLNIGIEGCGGEPPIDRLDDDRYEDNDISQEATSLAPGSYADLTLTAADDDWYVVEVCEGGSVEVDVLFSDLQGNIDAWLYNDALSYLDASFSSSDNEELSASNLTTQSVYIRVYSFGDEADYQLDITLNGCDGGLEADRLEENDTRETGEVLDPNLYRDLTITEGDEDWILFDVCEGGTITVNLTFSDVIGDIEARLYDFDGLARVSALSSTDNEELIYRDASAGQYALRIFGYGSNENTYDLEFSITNCDLSGLEPDRFEENDTEETGEVLNPGFYGDLTITQGDEDWILLDVCDGGTVTVDLTFSNALGDLDARLYDPDGLSRVNATGSTDNEELIYQNATGGQYALRVYSVFGDVENSYDLEIAITECSSGDNPGDQGDLQPDRLEDNDTRETGELLAPNLYSNLTITSGDRDWILFDVCEGGDIEVNLSFTHADGDIEARLYREAGFSVVSSLTSSDDEQLVYTNASAGQYAIEVFAYGTTENTYDLEFSVTGCGADGDPGDQGGIAPDRLEDNETRETAEILTPNLYSNLTITSGDNDWIGFDVCEGGDIEVEINFTDADGDLELELYDSVGVELDSSMTVTDNEAITYNNASAGRYYAYIFGYLLAENTYSLTIRVTCP